VTAAPTAAPTVAALALAAVLAGCPGAGSGPGPAPAPATKPGSAAAAGSAAAPAPAPPAPASEEERLAAIQKAMNELDEAAQACWAASAAEDIDIEGELVATIDIEPTAARVTLARDTTKTPALAACVAKVLSVYRWAPPLHGQAIQLPFRFRAPDRQSVIDRRLVPWKGQGKVAVAVLLDEQNTRNGAASMVEVALAAGGATGLRSAPRAELWYFLHPATVEGAGPASRRAVAAGDMMYVPAGAARDVLAGSQGEVRAVVVMTPGGREGSARAGALRTPEAGTAKAGVAGPVHLPAAAARRYPRPAGAVTIFAEPATIKEPLLAASVLELPKGAAIPEHVHATESELLYILAGSGTMTVKGVPLAVLPSSVVQIPPGARHAFTAAEDVRAVQIYTPAGPEQRFKAPPPAPSPEAKP